MKKNIVIACQSCGYLMRDIINAYYTADYEVTLISSQACWNDIKDGIPENIKFQRVIMYNRSSTLKRLWTWAVCTLQMWWKLLCFHNGEEVLYVSNPPIAPLIPLILNNKFSLLIWDVYPDVLVSQKVFKENSYVVKWWANKNRIVFEKAEHIFTLSTGMKDSLKKYVDEDKIQIVPLWPDSSALSKVKKPDNLFIKNNHLEGKFIVMYSGNMGDTHRMDVLVDVAKRICDEDVIFVFIGEGAKKKIIDQRMKQEKITNMLLLPYQPYDFLSHSLSAADIAVITLDSLSSQMSIPSKTFNMMKLGAPLLCIASPESELGRMVIDYQMGKVLLPECIEEMTQFVLELKNNKDVLTKYQQNSLEASKMFTSDNAKMFVN